MNDTPADLRSLLDRLKGAQHALIDEAARQPGLPSTAIIRRIADLENTIAAILALIEERQGSRWPRPFWVKAGDHFARIICTA
jgi:hypothetical protein